MREVVTSFYARLIQRVVPKHWRFSGQDLLVHLARGSTLKSHRDLEGLKEYVLHHLDDTEEQVDDAIVVQLKARRLIDSNKKFPAETYILTQRGQTAAAKLLRADPQSLSSRNF